MENYLLSVTIKKLSGSYFATLVSSFDTAICKSQLKLCKLQVRVTVHH